MKFYNVTLEVDYTIRAESLSEALAIAEKHTEHPIIGQGEYTFCADVRAIGGAIIKQDEDNGEEVILK
jgi:hypothetical protein